MTIFDIIVLSIIGLSVLVSMMKGAVAELTGLVVWLLAFWVAKSFAVPFSHFALTSVQPEGLSVVVAFVLLFIAAWIVQQFLRSLLTSAIKAIGLGIFDRLAGAMIGAIKGVFVVCLGVLVCAFTDLPQTPDWQHSLTAVYFEALVQTASPYLPPILAEQIHYPA